MPRVDPLCGLQDKILPRATRRLPRQSDHDLRQLAACSSLVYPDRAAAGRNALQCTAQPSPAYCTVELDLGTAAPTGPTSLPVPRSLIGCSLIAPRSRRRRTAWSAVESFRWGAPVGEALAPWVARAEAVGELDPASRGYRGGEGRHGRSTEGSRGPGFDPLLRDRRRAAPPLRHTNATGGQRGGLDPRSRGVVGRGKTMVVGGGAPRGRRLGSLRRSEEGGRRWSGSGEGMGVVRGRGEVGVGRRCGAGAAESGRRGAGAMVVGGMGRRRGTGPWEAPRGRWR